jgi:glycosyltransferase involved in cell wall biosynthesis
VGSHDAGDVGAGTIGIDAGLLAVAIKGDFVVWMNQPSHYQTAFFRELAAREGVSLKVWYARGQSADRRELGWRDHGAESYAYREAMVPRGLRRLGVFRQVWRERKAVHVINGVWAEPAFVLVALALVLVRANFFFHSEAANPDSERGGGVRALKYRFARWIVGRSRGMFLIGEKACRYYRRVGIPVESMFKFSYFVAGRVPSERVRSETEAFRVCYVGQFVARKRVEDLILVVTRLAQAGRAVCLTLVGAGPLRGHYRAMADAAGPGVIEIRPAVAPEQVPEILAQQDLLVLPSAFDGWGLTVNEALQAGVPVVVSDACGVAEVLERRPDWGVTFRAGEVDALHAALRRVADGPTRYQPVPAEVERVIGCSRMTDHFLACVAWRLQVANPSRRPALEW